MNDTKITLDRSLTPPGNKLMELFGELIQHDGFGEIRVEIKILKRQQKEVIIHCGKQYRYVVDTKCLTPGAVSHNG